MLDEGTSRVCLENRVESTLHAIEKEGYLLQVLGDKFTLHPKYVEPYEKLNKLILDACEQLDNLIDEL